MASSHLSNSLLEWKCPYKICKPSRLSPSQVGREFDLSGEIRPKAILMAYHP